jgi:hypothetical protein
VNKNLLKLIAVALFCTTIAAGAFAVNYYYKLSVLEADYQELLIELDEYTALIDIMIDYGNGTVVWNNDTRIQVGANLLNATDIICDIDVQSSNFGNFVTAINGVKQDAGHFWIWSIYEEEWSMGPVGADQFNLHEGDIVGWTYTSFQ